MDIKAKRLQLKNLENSPLYKFAVTSPKPVDLMSEEEVIQASKDIHKFFIKPLLVFATLMFILNLLPRMYSETDPTFTTSHHIDKVVIQNTGNEIVSSIYSEGSVYSVKKNVSFSVGQKLYLIKDRDAVTGKTEVIEACVGEVVPTLCNKILK